jgi:hypothetical protein
MSLPGTVSITLNGKPVSLVCSIEAVEKINTAFGNFYTAQERVRLSDFAAHCVVVAAGLGKEPRDVKADVYATGMLDLVKPLADQFLNMLANGGRPLTADVPKGGDSKNA